MKSIINREEELDIVNEELKNLTSDVRLVQRPILAFYGFKGMGKSRLLIEVAERCGNQGVRFIFIDAEHDFPVLSAKALKQIRNYLPQARQPESLAESLGCIENLLDDRKPFVLLIDGIDSTVQKLMSSLEALLSRVVRFNTVFVVMASQQMISFEQERNVARKLSLYPVKPLDKEYSKKYLLMLASNLSLTDEQQKLIKEQQDLIFAWTRGYPLAMQEMVRAFQKGVYFNDEITYSILMQHMVNSIIVEQLLAKVEEKDRSWFLAVLSLLAVPRRFNLLLMQQLIEQFEPEYKESSTLKYMLWPARINKATGVMDWKVARAGFTIDEPMRTILLLPLKIGHAERYREINLFLANINREEILEARGFDRAQYEKEYLYHRLIAARTDEKSTISSETIEEIIRLAEERSEELTLFVNEMLRDNDLQEEIGLLRLSVMSHLYQAIVTSFHIVYRREKDQQKRAEALYQLFYFAACIPKQEDALSVIKSYIKDVLEENDQSLFLDIFRRLQQDKQFLAVMGNEYNAIMSEIDNVTPSEE